MQEVWVSWKDQVVNYLIDSQQRISRDITKDDTINLSFTDI
jgi:hypothetical protein